MANGTKRRGSTRLGYGIAWAGLAVRMAILAAAPGPLIFNPAKGSAVAAGIGPEYVALGDVNGDERAGLSMAKIANSL